MLALKQVIRVRGLKELSLYFLSHKAATLNAPMPSGTIFPRLAEQLDTLLILHPT